MLDYTLSVEAETDLQNIYIYTLETWGRKQLIVYNDLIKTALDAIAENPQLIGYRERFDLAEGCCLYHVGHHFIAYRQKGVRVEIIRILHERMNIPVQTYL